MEEENKIISQLEKHLDEIANEAINFLVEMIKIPTENPPGRNYKDFAELFEKKLIELGYISKIVKVPQELLPKLVKFGEGDRYIIYGSKGKGRLKITFVGHYDVVPAGEGWKTDPFNPVIKDGYIYGRGASDMKSGLAVALFSVKLLEKIYPELLEKVTITQVVVPDEETVGNENAGAFFAVESGIITKQNTDFAIFTEPLGAENICFGHRGALLLKIKVYGEKSHGALAYLGKDAIAFTCKLIEKIRNYMNEKSESLISKYNIIPEGAKRPGYVIGTLQCGTWVNTVADKCEFFIFRRLIPEEKLSDVRAELTELITSMAKREGFNVEIEELYATESIIEDVNNKYYEAFRKAVKVVIGKEPNMVLSPGTFDMRFLHTKGVSSLNYGPGILEEAHKTDEKCSIDDIKKALVVMALGIYNMIENDK